MLSLYCQKMAIGTAITFLFHFIEQKAQSKLYPYGLALFLMLSSWFLAYPTFHWLNPEFEAWQTVMLKASDLTNSLTHIPPDSWLAKKVFRLTVPVIIRVFHLTPAAILLVQVMLGYSLYVLCYKLSDSILKDKVQATLLTAGIAFLYFGRTAWFDINYTWFDVFAYFFLLMAMYCQNIFAVFTCAMLAAWTDERGFIALSIVFLFHYLRDKINQPISISSIMRLNKPSMIVIFSGVLYLMVRQWLAMQYGMRTPTDGANFSVLTKTIGLMPIGAMTFMEGFWLILVASFVNLSQQKNYPVIALLLLPLSVLTVVSGCVTDITRSGSYLVPILFILINYLKYVQSAYEMRMLLLACLLISFLFPPTVVCGDWEAAEWFSSSINITKKLLKVPA